MNGFSKWPKQENTGRATEAIAGEVIQRRLSRFNEQELANLVNGFSKWPKQENTGRATEAIAGEVIQRRLSRFNEQELANLVNGFSKWPKQENTGRATEAIAGEVIQRRLSRFNKQELANLVNGFSKWPEQENTSRATQAIAGEVLRRGSSDFTRQGLANLVNGFSKWPAGQNTGLEAIAGEVIATEAIAGEVIQRRLSRFNEQELASLVDGFSKWPIGEDTSGAVEMLAGEVLRRLPDFNPQDLAMLVNGFSKWPIGEDTSRAAEMLAGQVLRRLPDFNPQELANLVNGFSKWPMGEDTSRAAEMLAGEVLRRLPDFNPQELADLVNGFSKWPAEERMGQAAAVIAGEVLRRQLADFTPLALANLANGFSKWLDEETCRQALLDIARGLGRGKHRFGAFTTPQLSMLANALARSVMAAEDSAEMIETALLKDRLHKLAHHLHYADDRLKTADVLSISNILKALDKTRLVDDLGLLARPGLNRLEELRHQPAFAAENNLEAMGNLCVAVLPLARSSQKELRWHRRPALNLLNNIQGVVMDKIAAHLGASDAERIRGPLASRCPALSMYQVLKARAVLEKLYRRPHIEGNKSDLKARQQELQAGTKDILHRTGELIERDLSNMSWNLIAQIGADSPLDALDSFLAENAATVQADRPASQFNVHQVLQEMDHEPRPAAGDGGTDAAAAGRRPAGETRSDRARDCRFDRARDSRFDKAQHSIFGVPSHDAGAGPGGRGAATGKAERVHAGADAHRRRRALPHGLVRRQQVEAAESDAGANRGARAGRPQS
ncbi:DUF1601 domain-containing protein [Bradyrhizobium lupini]|uniref:DUF1601 domain-containing protein n=1 Tax=Rhizobium lupini TaxID=136996 RepID=UPI003671A75F